MHPIYFLNKMKMLTIKNNKSGSYNSKFKGRKRDCKICGFTYHENTKDISDTSKGWICRWCNDKEKNK